MHAAAHMHTPTVILRGPCVWSQTVKCSVSMPSQGVPSALGFVMTCRDVSAMLDLCAEPAGIPSRSTNAFPGYPGAEKRALPVAGSLQVYVWIYRLFIIKLLCRIRSPVHNCCSASSIHIWLWVGVLHDFALKELSIKCKTPVLVQVGNKIVKFILKLIHFVFLHNCQESSAVQGLQ